MLRAFIKKLLRIQSPSLKASGYDYEYDYKRAKRAEANFLRLNPSKATVEKSYLKGLEDIANAPIMPDIHVTTTRYNQRTLRAEEIIPYDWAQVFKHDENLKKHIRYRLFDKFSEALMDKMQFSIEYDRHLGQYVARAYYRIFEEV